MRTTLHERPIRKSSALIEQILRKLMLAVRRSELGIIDPTLCAEEKREGGELLRFLKTKKGGETS